jgi:tetratricopeptide (TPR) repeat protein
MEKNPQPNKSKNVTGKNVPSKNPAPAPAKVAAPPVKVPPMFRKVDWLTMGLTFIVIWAIYLWTVAPEQTLEDSGELCTASYYAGIPHPPGYPFWAIYSWFWTAILPFGNVAWRVEVGQSFAAAVGCGMLSLMVSRGSSMLIEGIDEIKNVARQWENAICAVSGFVAGMLLGLDAFMWSESVVINRISVFGVPWLIAVVLFLMRWSYAPQQRRYLYLAMFFYGISATIHQTLLLSAMGVEVLIALALPRLGRDLFLTNSVIYVVGLMLMSAKNIPALNNMSTIEVNLFHIVGVGSIITGTWLAINTQRAFTEWKSIILMGVAWVGGILFYFYEPIAGMTDPPMQWGYPRTVEGFFHALSRGQYETISGTNIFSDPGRFMFQLWYIVQGLSESFSWVYVFVGLLPFLFLMKMQRRERSWIIGVSSIYVCLCVLLVVLINVSPDRQSQDLNKVFFTASHGLFALMIGYGLTLMAAYVATHYQKFRLWGFVGGGVAVILALFCLKDATGKVFFGPAGEVSLTQLPHHIALAFDKDQYGLPVFANLILVLIPLVFIAALLVYRTRGPVLILLGLFLVMPVYSGLTHWYKSEQRNHWFGYWFGHDMFTPPFTDPKTGQLSYDNVLRADLLKNPENAKIIYPEMARNTILFGGTDPGRFCPTYAIFCDSFIPHDCQPLQDQKFDRRDCYLITQNALADGTYLDYLRAQYNRSKQIDPVFFSNLFRYIAAVIGIGNKSGVIMDGEEMGTGDSGNGLVEGIAKMLDYTLDKPFTNLGKKIETRRRAQGVYPPAEIYIPSPEDSQDCFQEYARQKQLSANNGSIQVSGQADVMAINGLLCKVIFDNNPTNEFYVEESFPLDWMYPYESPFGIIMKINRNPLPELTDDIFQRDHAFWTEYASRLCGNWITYDTTPQQIADFAERTYIGNNYKNFTGARSFVRDDDAQKAFSKLRSSQAGMYSWRCFPNTCPPEYRQKTPAAQAALLRETEFALKQSFAFCPYSPEALYRYVNFLLQLGRFDDALLIAHTCQKLDPFNDQLTGLLDTLQKYKEENAGRAQVMSHLEEMESIARTNPNNVTNLLALSMAAFQMQQTNQAVTIMEQALASTNLTYDDAAIIAQGFAQLGDLSKVEIVLKKMIALKPNEPEAQYDLARLQASTGRDAEALQTLKSAIALSTRRLATNHSAHDLAVIARSDASFNSIRNLPEFQKLVAP